MASRQYRWAEKKASEGLCRICGSNDTTWYTKAGIKKVSGYCAVHREYQRLKMVGIYKKKTKRENV